MQSVAIAPVRPSDPTDTNPNTQTTNEQGMTSVTKPAAVPSSNQSPWVTPIGVDPFRDLSLFVRVKTLGEGTFGRVYLVRNVVNRSYYALKVLRKSTIIKLKQYSHIKNEKEILQKLDCPFAIKLYKTFQDADALYLVTEFVVGGELFTFMRSRGPLPMDLAVFYAAEIVVVLEYLHSRGIVYRDLKPENILIGADGHIKLCDFGFAKNVGDQLTWTMCGTPEYLAPEVVQLNGHNCAADWWSLGVLIFEMLAGYPPFYHQDPMQIYAQITAGNVHFPPNFDPVARNLCANLMAPNKALRLGVRSRGIREVMEHPFFRNIDWDKVRNKQMRPPWIPPVRGPGDAHLFTMFPGSECFPPGWHHRFSGGACETIDPSYHLSPEELKAYIDVFNSFG